MKVAGLFAGIGGIELGLSRAKHHTTLLCEVDPGARRVLKTRFPNVRVHSDVRALKSIGSVDILTAGFPCQDLSQAGRTAGITGANSGLVGQVFRLLDGARTKPRWIMLENVPFMLQLDQGRAMRFLVNELERREFRWAYRVVDTQSLGLPQRRQRVILVASRDEDPGTVLFADEATPPDPPSSLEHWCGFYWTEGLRGLGWAVDSVPTLKGGSTIGIPSPPAIWNPFDGTISTPDIRDMERLQGFAENWTVPALGVDGVRRGHRWKLVGNAVSVPVAEWVGSRLAKPGKFDSGRIGEPIRDGVSWPKAACGDNSSVSCAVKVSMWPKRESREHLSDFIKYPLVPLSARAAAGFKSRLDASQLKYPKEFGLALARYVKHASRFTAA